MQAFEVLIIGGSYAGLSAALALGRSRRNVLVIDSGNPCNIQTPHSQNFLTHDGKTPAELFALAKADVEKYPTIEFLNGLAVSAVKTDFGFDVITADGSIFQTKKLIFATGVSDLMPDIDGFKDCWGISVIHCPYCHGYEYRDRKTLALANGEAGLHYARLVGNLTDDLTLLTNGPSACTPEQHSELLRRNVRIIEKKVAGINHVDGYMTHVVFADGSTENADALYARLPFLQKCQLPQTLGCELNGNGLIITDPFQKTTVPNSYACGDNVSPMRSVANAVAAGNITGAMVNMELCG